MIWYTWEQHSHYLLTYSMYNKVLFPALHHLGTRIQTPAKKTAHDIWQRLFTHNWELKISFYNPYGPSNIP